MDEQHKAEDDLQSVANHQPCPDCGSTDALTINTNGSTKCYSCGVFTPSSKDAKSAWNNPRPSSFVQGTPMALTKRRISEEICRKYGYETGESNGRPCQIANYRASDGKLLGQKIRYPDKTFRIAGKCEGLFGSHRFGGGGKRLTVTEGEIDALSVATVFDGKWPVVSIPNGAAGAVASFKKNLEYLEAFDHVVIMFDMDEVGQQAAKNCASILSVGKASIARLSAKDPNELLKSGKGQEIIQAFWNAEVYRPDGIVLGTDMWEKVSTNLKVDKVEYPFFGLSKMTRGLRKGEIVTFCAGSGVGKSTIVREIAYSLLQKGEMIGYIALEESVRRSALGIMGLAMDRPLHLEMDVDAKDPAFIEAYEKTIGSGNFVTYDHWGSIESDNLINRIRYMHKGLGCQWIFLDHVSIVVSGQEGDERKMLDMLMTKLRSLVEETNIGLVLISHLKRPEGRGFEEGRQITLGHLRGSAGLGQLSDMVIGVERDQQDDEVRNRSTVRVLKNRWSGETGVACYLNYDIDTGRISEDVTFIETEDTMPPANDSESTTELASPF